MKTIISKSIIVFSLFISLPIFAELTEGEREKMIKIMDAHFNNVNFFDLQKDIKSCVNFCPLVTKHLNTILQTDPIVTKFIQSRVELIHELHTRVYEEIRLIADYLEHDVCLRLIKEYPYLPIKFHRESARMVDMFAQEKMISKETLTFHLNTRIKIYFDGHPMIKKMQEERETNRLNLKSAEKLIEKHEQTITDMQVEIDRLSRGRPCPHCVFTSTTQLSQRQ